MRTNSAILTLAILCVTTIGRADPSGVGPADDGSFQRPRIAGPYVHVYKPGPDVFPGPDSPHFRAGETYPEWGPNDFSILKGPDGRWHALGITHPVPRADWPIHEGEWMAFHAAAPPGSLKDHLCDGAWKDLPKVLPPSARPGELKPLFAPYILQRDGVYHMIYGPSDMRLATSKDLFSWTPKGTLFSQDGGARDPCVLPFEGRYHMVYVAGNSLYARTSTDLVTWSDPPRVVFEMDRPGSPESPVLLRRGDDFYLFWCIYDGTNGAYDNRTYVFRSSDPLDFRDARPLAMLQAHAPEVFCDEDGDWYIASVEWPHRGVSIAPLSWE